MLDSFSFKDLVRYKWRRDLKEKACITFVSDWLINQGIKPRVINSFQSPRDKFIIIVFCCGLIRLKWVKKYILISDLLNKIEKAFDDTVGLDWDKY